MSKFSIVQSFTSNAINAKIKSNLPVVNANLADESEKSSNENRLHVFFGPDISGLLEKPRVLHATRYIQMRGKKVWMESEPLVHEEVHAGNSLFASSWSAAGRFLGKKVASIANGTGLPVGKVHAGSFCDGCGRDPIVGNMWSCTDCESIHLCDTCYKEGLHGFEDSSVLLELKREYAVHAMVELCKQRVPEETFNLILHNVCKGQVDKFNFLSNWIAGLVLGHCVSKLTVRGIVLPSLDTKTRTSLVRLLTPLLASRTDINVKMEWSKPEGEDLNEDEEIMNLKIWIVSDQEEVNKIAESAVDTPPVGKLNSVAEELSPVMESILSSPTCSKLNSLMIPTSPLSDDVGTPTMSEPNTPLFTKQVSSDDIESSTGLEKQDSYDSVGPTTPLDNAASYPLLHDSPQGMVPTTPILLTPVTTPDVTESENSITKHISTPDADDEVLRAETS